MSGDFQHGPVVAQIHATGEIVDVKDRSAHRRRIAHEGLRYMLISASAAIEIMPRLSPLQTKIVGLILNEYREGEPWARMTVSELAAECGLPVQNIYRALGPLTKSGVVMRPSKTVWQVNPHVGWRGPRKAWEAAMKTSPKPNEEEL